MKKIQIKTKDFFELLKIKETSMWDIFTQMIDNEEKEIIFLDNDNNILFNFIGFNFCSLWQGKEYRRIY
mgnify:CR=1 FL=1